MSKTTYTVLLKVFDKTYRCKVKAESKQQAIGIVREDFIRNHLSFQIQEKHNLEYTLDQILNFFKWTKTQ